MSNSENYYRRRIEEEAAAAEKAECPSTAMIHRELARRYRELLMSEPGPLGPDAAHAPAREPVSLPSPALA